VVVATDATERVERVVEPPWEPAADRLSVNLRPYGCGLLGL
jgi:hypothetical protein